ncbi:SDR family NAD(P)-dependent oxidoreductase [Dickeya zeae]|uniref:SDR family NAD(P)-dependent oxidoreductase n=1 Tax=Dickeya zeae TaxID=204042 RepID=UPI00143FDE97|nr:SDR family NAD(P)-dependent oxidoreductase [Dickeya zeae]QIZ47632.1 SDR family oxidoreductase [Dickeya zeae]
MLLKGKNVLITGTRRGMGKSMVEAFAANGANIYAHARQETPDFVSYIQSIASKYQVEIWPLYFDMTDSIGMKAAIKKLMTEKKTIHALVNNAGITLNSLFQMTTEDILRRQFEVNFFSVFLFTQYVSKLMVRQKTGSIINISSTAGEDGNPGKSAYGASKAAVMAMTKSIAAELGEYGIRANSIAPGVTDTDMLETLPASVLDEAIKNTKILRVGKPEEIADTAVFLASDLSTYITGQVIRVDGGLTL